MLKFLRNAYANMTSGKANDDLQRINSIMGLSSGMQANRNVYIISSMAGGSGSGLFQDVAELLKAVEPSLDNFMHVMLYGSDVFGLSLNDDAMKWVHGNTLGALA
ncbi:MAG: tubulin-like doman-containing protein, partial [Candidatus Fonsibacter sp.]